VYLVLSIDYTLAYCQSKSLSHFPFYKEEKANPRVCKIKLEVPSKLNSRRASGPHNESFGTPQQLGPLDNYLSQVEGAPVTVRLSRPGAMNVNCQNSILTPLIRLCILSVV
jgi:hypothetical protein